MPTVAKHDEAIFITQLASKLYKFEAFSDDERTMRIHVRTFI